jgi:hypothetical protein
MINSAKIAEFNLIRYFMHKLLKTIAVCGFLALSANAYSQVGVDIHVRPPHARMEVRGTAPGAGMVWQGGYHRWDEGTHAYIWTGGTWAAPPHERARWVQPRYARQHGAWRFREGYWR